MSCVNLSLGRQEKSTSPIKGEAEELHFTHYAIPRGDGDGELWSDLHGSKDVGEDNPRSSQAHPCTPHRPQQTIASNRKEETAKFPFDPLLKHTDTTQQGDGSLQSPQGRHNTDNKDTPPPPPTPPVQSAQGQPTRHGWLSDNGGRTSEG